MVGTEDIFLQSVERNIEMLSERRAEFEREYLEALDNLKACVYNKESDYKLFTRAFAVSELYQVIEKIDERIARQEVLRNRILASYSNAD